MVIEGGIVSVDERILKQPLVSVVVPVYNVERYLDRCLDSVVNQFYPNLEIILIDDGSLDSCPKLCDEWAIRDSRIKVIHKANQGLGMARNTGIENVSGDYLCFVDSDDYIDPSTIFKCVVEAQRQRAEVVVYGMKSVNSRGGALSNNLPASDRLVFIGDEVREFFLPDLICGKRVNCIVENLPLSACSCLFSMELVRRTNWRFVSERSIISEDSYSLIWLYQYVNRVSIIPEILYFHCINENSLTRTYRDDRFHKLKHFHAECRCMAVSAGHNNAVLDSIDGLFLSFVIAAMKQIVAENTNLGRKMQTLGEILGDSTLQKLSKSGIIYTFNKTKRILFWAIRNKINGLVYLLLLAQVLKEKFKDVGGGSCL